jgi:hypothetical protein
MEQKSRPRVGRRGGKNSSVTARRRMRKLEWRRLLRAESDPKSLGRLIERLQLLLLLIDGKDMLCATIQGDFLVCQTKTFIIQSYNGRHANTVLDNRLEIRSESKEGGKQTLSVHGLKNLNRSLAFGLLATTMDQIHFFITFHLLTPFFSCC